MRLDRLTLEHFRSYGSADLDLRALDTVAIVGVNGAGKSSIPVAIDYALFGGGADELMSRGAQSMAVALWVSDEKESWKVTRGRERRKSWLVIERNARAIDTHTIADGQRIIERDLLGMDADAFRASVYAPQGQAGLLAQMAPRERKALLGGLLGLDRYEEWREAAAGDAREASARRDAGAGRIASVQEEISELDVENLEDLEEMIARVRSRIEALEAEEQAARRREKIAEQVERRRELVARMEELKERKAKVLDRKRQREEFEQRLGECEGAQERLDELEERLNAHRVAQAGRSDAESRLEAAHARVDSNERIVEGARTKVEAAERSLASLDAASAEPEPRKLERCPTCGQEVAGEAAAQASAKLAEVQAADRERLRDRVREVNEALEQAEAGLTEAQESARAAAAEIPEEVGPFPELDAYKVARLEVMEAATIAGRIEALADDESIESIRERWEAAKVEAVKLPKKVPEGRPLGEIGADLRRQRELLEDAQQRRVRAEEEAARRDRLSDLVARLERELAGEGRRAAALQVCTKAFSRAGIPAMILDNAVVSIEAAANEALGSFGAQMAIRLVTQREKKGGGGLTETLDILVDDGTYERPLEGFSGGEQYRVHVALRLALARTLAAGSGRQLDFLMIDEPTDLDAEGVSMLAEMLVGMEQQVLLVTHQEELVSSLPQVLAVERDGDAGSVIRGEESV